MIDSTIGKMAKDRFWMLKNKNQFFEEKYSILCLIMVYLKS